LRFKLLKNDGRFEDDLQEKRFLIDQINQSRKYFSLDDKQEINKNKSIENGKNNKKERERERDNLFLSCQQQHNSNTTATTKATTQSLKTKKIICFRK